MPLSLYDLNISKASLAAVDTANNGLMLSTDKIKLDSIANGATNVQNSVTNGNIKINNTETVVYTHPATHAATMITDDATHRFTTDTEKSTWNAKATTAVVTTSANGLMISTDKAKLDGIAASATAVTDSSVNGNIKINGTESVVYTHPASHLATMITDDSTHRFVTDTEKSTWNAKFDKAGGTITGATTISSDLTVNRILPKYTAYSAVGDGGAAIVNSNEATYQSLMITGNNSKGDGVRRVKIWDECTISSGLIVGANASIGGAASVGSTLSVGGTTLLYGDTVVSTGKSLYFGTAGESSDTIRFYRSQPANDVAYLNLEIGDNPGNGGVSDYFSIVCAGVAKHTFTSGGDYIFQGTIMRGATTIVDSTGKVWGAVYNDLAEGFKALNIDELEPGDVLEQGPNGVVKSSKFNSRKVVGVYSDTYGFCLGANGEEELKKQGMAPVGLAGRVNVKVTGPAEVGDLLVASDIPGVAIVNNDARLGTVIGKVMEDKTSLDIERISMLILNA